jgi:hypothetical protein
MKKDKIPKYTVEESPDGGWNVWFAPEPTPMLVIKLPTRKAAKAFAKRANTDDPA